MKKNEEKTIYESPEVKICQTHVRRILCASMLDTEHNTSDFEGGEDLNF